VVRRVDDAVTSVGRHDLGGDHRVDRHAELANEKSDAAVERDAAHTDGAGVAEADDQAVLRERFGDLKSGRSGSDPRGARAGVDLDLREIAQIDDESAVRGAVADDAVPAAAHSELISFL